MAQCKKSKMDTIRITIPAKPQYLKIIRAAMNSICQVRGICKEDLNNLILAVDEAASNIIKHAYNGPTEQPIYVKINICSNRIEIILRDLGEKADVKKIKPRELDDVRPGGLGVHFIKSVMDEVVYDNSLKNGNKLKMIKMIH